MKDCLEKTSAYIFTQLCFPHYTHNYELSLQQEYRVRKMTLKIFLFSYWQSSKFFLIHEIL